MAVEYKDYVVALDPKGRAVLAVWSGARFRPYDEARVNQWRVGFVVSKEAAIKSAERMQEQVDGIRREWKEWAL